MTRTDPRMGEFDEMDLEILRRIEADFDVSLDALANELDLSRSAIHYRIKSLKEDDVIQSVSADLDPMPFGLDMVALTEVSVTHDEGYSETIGEDLSAIDGVEQVYYTMGDVDFVTVTRVQDRDQMNGVIEQMVAIDGVNETSSRFVMNEIESNPQVMPSMSTEMEERIVEHDE